VHCGPVLELFSQIRLGAVSIDPTVQTCSTQFGLCHRGGLRTAYLLVSELSAPWLPRALFFITVSLKKSYYDSLSTFILAMTVVSYCYDRDHIFGIQGRVRIDIENTTSAELPRRPWDADGVLRNA
jgi:hypothetical protein